MARTVDDVLSRRTRARLLARDDSAAAAAAVAALIGPQLGWDAAERAAPGRDVPALDRRRSAPRQACPRSRSTPRWAPDGRDADDLPIEPGPGAPTPPIPLPDPSDRHRPARRTSAVPVPDAAARPAWPPTGAGVAVDRRRPGRGQPRLVAAGHDLGRSPTRWRRWPPRWCAPTDRRPGRPRCCALCHEAGVPGHRRPAGAAASSGGSVPVFGGVRARPVRPGRHPVGRPRRRWSSTSPPAPSATASSRAAPRPRPHRGPLAPVDDPVHRRRLAGVSGRRSALEPVRQDRGHRGRPRRRARRRHRTPHRGPRPPGGRPRPHPAVRRLRGHARRDHRGPPPGVAGARRPSAAPPSAFATFAEGARRLPAHRAARAHPRRAAALRRRSRPSAATPRATAPSCWSSTRATRSWWRRRPPSPTTRARDAERLDDELVERWLGHRNDVSALEALIAAGYVVDTMELTGRLAARWRRLYTRRPRRHRLGARGHRLVGPPLPQLPGRGLPLLHLRRAADRRHPRGHRRAATSPAGTRDPHRAEPRRLAQPPPRGGPQPGPLRRRGPRARGSDVLRRSSGALDPTRHPQPGQAGAHQPPVPWGSRPLPRRIADEQLRPPGRSSAGAISGLFFALPAAILQRTVFADTAMAGVMLAIVLFAGALAGFGAALGQPPRMPLDAGRRGRAAHVRRRPARLHHRHAEREPGVHRVRRVAVLVARHHRRLRGADPGGPRDHRRRGIGEHPGHRRRHLRGPGRRGAPDATVTAEHRIQVLPATPAPGLVEFDASAMAGGSARRWPEPEPGRGRAGGRRRRRQPAGLDGRVGPRDRRARRSRARLAGPAHRRRLPGLAGRGPAAGTEPVGHQDRQHLLDGADPDRARDLCVGTVDSWIVWHLTGRRTTSPTSPTPRSPGCSPPTPRGWDHDVLDRLRIPVAALPPTRRLHRARSAPPPPCTAHPRVCGIAGDQQASLVGQGCVAPGPAKITFGTGGMLDLVVGPDRPGFASRGPAGTFPIVAWRRGEELIWGLEAIMLSAGTNVEWLRDDLGLIPSAEASHDVAAACADTEGVVYVPALLGPGHPAVGLRRPRHAARPHPGHRPGPRGASRARGRRPARCRPGRGRRGRRRRHHPRTLRVDGGMTANPTFVQALADATQRPVEVSPVLEATTLGAAFLAGLDGRRLGRLGRRRRRLAAQSSRSNRARPSTASAGPERSSGPASGTPSSPASTSDP